MNAVATLQAPRLPYHSAVEERFGVDKSGWKALVEAVFPAAQTSDSVIMALSYCKARGLDPFKRPVHIVPVWDSKRNAMVETVWPGIAELRTTAMRTGTYAGREKTIFGPLIEMNLDGIAVTFPEWAQVTVLKLVAGHICRFEGPETYWLESYATAKRTTKAPNAMWLKRPRGQLDKCAEAAALRMAFPEELGGEYAAEEIEGQALNPRDSTPQATGLRERLAAYSDSPTGGFSTGHVSATLDEALDGDAIPSHDPDTGEIVDAEVEAEEAAEATGDAPEVTAGQSEPELPAGLKTGRDLLEEQQDKAAPFDHLSWAADLNRDVESMSLEEIDRLVADPTELARFEELKAKHPAIAKQLDDAIGKRRKARI